MTPRKILAILGIVACLMVLFPPVHTYSAPVFVEDRGIEWQLSVGRRPDLILADAGGFRNKRFAFILSLDEGDKIRFPQLAVQVVVLVIAGLAIVAWKGKENVR